MFPLPSTVKSLLSHPQLSSFGLAFSFPAPILPFSVSQNYKNFETAKYDFGFVG
jgi:hypothetical protein